MNTALEFACVSKHLGVGAARHCVLREVDLQIACGEMVAVTGPSGSGKTTLLSLAGLLDTPDGGAIRLAGVDLSDMDARLLCRHRRRDLGFVFQGFNLMPVLTALENVELALHGLVSNVRRRREAAAAALVHVGLEDALERRPGDLSGGQQQRVGMARALVRRPRLIIADEPTANLDRATRDLVTGLLMDLVRSEGLTLLLSTHDESVAAGADRVLMLEDGVLVNETPGHEPGSRGSAATPARQDADRNLQGHRPAPGREVAA